MLHHRGNLSFAREDLLHWQKSAHYQNRNTRQNKEDIRSEQE
jgi:hypothetical protein